MVSFMVILSGMEIVVWAALLFTVGFVLHFWWMRNELLPSDPTQKEKSLNQELDRWKKRFLQETKTLSRELDRLRIECESAAQQHQILQEARTLHADLHRAEVRIEELELKLMDREDEIDRLKSAGGSGDVNEELLEKISQLESQLIHARSIAESLERSQSRVRELEESLAESERRLQSLTGSNNRLTEENNEQYSHFKSQMNELVAARQRLAQLESQVAMLRDEG